jgi:hypothetical protein
MKSETKSLSIPCDGSLLEKLQAVQQLEHIPSMACVVRRLLYKALELQRSTEAALVPTEQPSKPQAKRDN